MDLMSSPMILMIWSWCFWARLKILNFTVIICKYPPIHFLSYFISFFGLEYWQIFQMWKNHAYCNLQAQSQVYYWMILDRLFRLFMKLCSLQVHLQLIHFYLRTSYMCIHQVCMAHVSKENDLNQINNAIMKDLQDCILSDRSHSHLAWTAV